MPTSLSRNPITVLTGVGPRMAERLGRLNIHTVEDLYFHLPTRYEDRTRVWSIGELSAGDTVLVEGTVVVTDIRFARRRMLVSRLRDSSGEILLKYFHFSSSQRARLAPGTRLRCFGEARLGAATLEMVHPETQVLRDAAPSLATHLTAIYPAVDGIRQGVLRRLVDQALKLTSTVDPLEVIEEDRAWNVAELLPREICKALGLPTLVDALRFLHQPPVDVSLTLLNQVRHPAQQRLIFEELLAHHLSLKQLRLQVKNESAPALTAPDSLTRALLDALPFRLTAAQQRALDEIRSDIARPHPMHRLLQGDVGSGKTLVATLAMLTAIEARYQAVMMAPTELLAEQHYTNLRRWLEPLGIRTTWIAGTMQKKARRETLDRVARGEVALVVGTHALFQADVSFDRLGIIVIDEQHRFGVHQRLALREKRADGSEYPHQLTMTATPIPRTLAMTAYADLDLSVIDEMPPGRQPVETVAVSEKRREDVMTRILEACRSGRQAFWVCTLIDESESLQCQAAVETFQWLAERLTGLRVGLVHGRLKSLEKEAVMNAFRRGDIDLLVATTVIEVGVDVEQATLMIIENAERLGLAQLHQLRGRVGRGTERSVCVLMYRGPLSEPARARLAVMRDTNDGFEIARRDLALRGPGEVLGTRQSGDFNFRIADLVRDQGLIQEVERGAKLLLKRYPRYVQPLVRRWLGDVSRYGGV